AATSFALRKETGNPIPDRVRDDRLGHGLVGNSDGTALVHHAWRITCDHAHSPQRTRRSRPPPATSSRNGTRGVHEPADPALIAGNREIRTPLQTQATDT